MARDDYRDRDRDRNRDRERGRDRDRDRDRSDGKRRTNYENRGIFRNFLSYMEYFRNYKLKVFWTIIFYIIAYVPVASFSIIVKLVVDTYIPAGDITKIYFAMILIVIFGLINISYWMAFGASRTDIIKNVSRDMRNNIVTKLQILSLQYHSVAETGRLYSKIMVDVNKIEFFGDALFNSVLAVIVALLYSVIVLALVNPKILLVLLLIVPVVFITQRLFKNMLERQQHLGRMVNEDLSFSVATFLQTAFLSRVHGEEDFEKRKIDEKNRNIVSRYRNIVFRTALFGASNSVLTQLLQFGLLIMLALAVINKQILIGELFLFQQFAGNIIGNVSAIVNQYNMFLEFSESMSSINEILTAPDIEYNEGKKKIASLKGDIFFEDVTFGFDPTRPVLKHITVRISKGETVALVGASGGGKTTFANLILGLYRPLDGMIYLDGMPIDELDMRIVRQFVGVVTQDPILFTGSVEDNIRHARKASAADMIAAAQKANAHEFIEKLQEKYATIIGERGVTLSGGQRQRIAIARALMRDPAILILDEATSALDSESEQQIQKAIESMLGNQTTVIIAHRLSTIMNADKILVFKEGQIVETGTHAELIEKKGEYAKLVDLQLNLGVEQMKQAIS
ncbi:MAG: ABC transporter ATP-binding protein [Spirochaetes bacterium]|nr:ABC transporter ATP-binding protein [Spirochaetota bacterium]